MQMKFMIPLKADKNTEAGATSRREAARGNREVQRRYGEGGRVAHRRRTLSGHEGRARQTVGRKTNYHRRTFSGNESTDRRLLDDLGEV